MNASQKRRQRPGYALFFVATTLIVALLFGGGPANVAIPYYIVVFAGVVSGLCVLLGTGNPGLTHLPRAFWAVVLLILALPLLQLIPLPPDIWQHLPGRMIETHVRELAGVSNWPLPVALQPAANWQLVGALILLTLFAVAVARLSGVDRDRLIIVLLVFAGLEFAVGAIQFSSAGSALDIFGNSHKGWLLGSFANRNHAALFFACCIILSSNLLSFEGLGARPKRRAVGPLIVAALTALWLVATLGTGSRTGLALSLLAIIMVSFPAIKRSRLPRWLWVIGAAALAIGIVAISWVPRIQQVLDRYATVGDDQRWSIWRNTWEQIIAYWPWGAGFGSFGGIYDAHEPLAELSPVYVNNAHNDYLELMLEAGLPSVILLILVIALLVAGVIRSSRREDSRMRRHVMIGAGMVVLIALHSVVDYPVRRMGMATMLFLGFGFILSPYVQSRTKAKGSHSSCKNDS